MMHTRSRSWAGLVAAGLLLAFGPQSGSAAAVHNAGGAATMDRAGVATSAIVRNIRVSHDRFPDHAEPALAVNPRNPLTLLGAAMDFQSAPTPGTFASFDGGRSWRDNGALPLPAGFTQGGDVSAAFTPQGIGFVAAEGINALNPDSRGVYVWRTDDGGRTFQRPVAVASDGFVDHPWLAAATTPGHGPGLLYVAWVTRSGAAGAHVEGLAFSRSVDGGHSFAAPRIISAPAGGITAPVVAAGPGGAVYVAFDTTHGTTLHTEPRVRRQDGRGVRATPPQLAVEVIGSTDDGLHFGRATSPGPTVFGLAPASGLLIPTGPSLATDPRDGTVYAAYAANRAGTTHMDVLVARSQDAGRTWSVPMRVTNERLADDSVYFQPRVVVLALSLLQVRFVCGVIVLGLLAVTVTIVDDRGLAWAGPGRVPAPLAIAASPATAALAGRSRIVKVRPSAPTEAVTTGTTAAHVRLPPFA